MRVDIKIFFKDSDFQFFSKYFKNLVVKKISKKNFFAGVSANFKKIKKKFQKFFRNFQKKKIFEIFFLFPGIGWNAHKKFFKKKFLLPNFQILEKIWESEFQIKILLFLLI